MIKIKTINNYKLLARLFKLQQIQKEREEYKLAIDLVLTNFKLKYPDINMDDLKEGYTINIDNEVDFDKTFIRDLEDGRYILNLAITFNSVDWDDIISEIGKGNDE